MTADDFSPGANLRQVNGEWQLLQPLNKERVNAIKILLGGQSSADLLAFETMLTSLLDEGYQLSSLLVDLRCPSAGPLKVWKCVVRPKIGARPLERPPQISVHT